MEDVHNKRGYAHVGVGRIWTISIQFSQFCCEPKSALQIVLINIIIKNN